MQNLLDQKVRIVLEPGSCQLEGPESYYAATAPIMGSKVSIYNMHLSVVKFTLSWLEYRRKIGISIKSSNMGKLFILSLTGWGGEFRG